MDVALLISRLLLAVVFLLAGVTKVLDRSGSRQALVDFGIPVRFSRFLGLVLPLSELLVAIALIPRPTAWWGALGACILLSLFVTGIAVALARGKAPDCHCFGQLYSAPVGRSTLVRNTALATLAGFVLWQGREDAGASAVAWIDGFSPAERTLLLITGIVTAGLVAEGRILFHLVQQNGRLLLRLDALDARIDTTGQVPAVPSAAPQSPSELPIGSVAPAFRLHDVLEGTTTLADLLAYGKPVFLVFSDSGCSSCTALLPEIASWQQEVSGVTVAVISRGTPASHRAKLADLGVRHVLLQDDRETARAYGALATPGAVIVQPDGTIGSRVVIGPVAIRALIEPWIEGSSRIPSATTEPGTQGLVVGPVPARPRSPGSTHSPVLPG